MRVLVTCLITAAAEIILAVREGTIVSAVCLRSMMWVPKIVSVRRTHLQDPQIKADGHPRSLSRI